jgi:hypothetical protein
MLIINFSHPLTTTQLARIAEMTGQMIERVLDVPAQFDPARSYVEQGRDLADKAGLTAEQWQTLPLLVNLPSHNVIAAVLLAELHGRAGYFPAVLRLRPIAGVTPPQYEVAELINLQEMRDLARKERL